MSTKKISWKPTQEITISGEQLEDLLRLGELFLLPPSSVSEDMRAKVYLRFLEAKDAIIDSMLEDGSASEDV